MLGLMSMERINGNVYFGDKASLEGWNPKIGNFQILDAEVSFRRYTAHKLLSIEQLQSHYGEIAELAKKYGTKSTEILFTVDLYYDCIPHANIFFLNENAGLVSNFLTNDLKTIQRKLENTSSLKNAEILLSIDIDRRKSSCVSVDIKEPLKKVHKELFESLDNILFTAKPQ